MRITSWVAAISMLNTPTGRPSVDRSVLGDVHRERRFAHTRPTGDDHQVARLQPRGHAVEVDEAGRHAGDVAVALAVVQQVDALHHLGEQRRHVLEALLAARALLGDLEHFGLGLVEHCVASLPMVLYAESAISVPTSARRRRMARSRTISA